MARWSNINTADTKQVLCVKLLCTYFRYNFPSEVILRFLYLYLISGVTRGGARGAVRPGGTFKGRQKLTSIFNDNCRFYDKIEQVLEPYSSFFWLYLVKVVAQLKLATVNEPIILLS